MRRPQKFGPYSNYNLTLQNDVKIEWKMGQIVVTFSEYLNFKVFHVQNPQMASS
jgi:hypothetical protein